MKNYEKYAEQIKNYDSDNFCKDFIQPIIFKKDNCGGITCGYCRMLQILWLMEEYEEPDVDWSKVEVDTPILVGDYNKNWYKRYFAKYENGKVYAWANGRTSWNESVVNSFEYAKLAEGEDE